MVTGDLPFDLFVQPLSGLMVLTSGAVAISTGAIDPMELATTFALIKGDAAELGATADAGMDDFAVCSRHEMEMAFQVLGPKVRKISLIVVMVQPLHYLIDQLTGILLPLLGEM